MKGASEVVVAVAIVVLVAGLAWQVSTTGRLVGGGGGIGGGTGSSSCGNNTVESGEKCDGTNLGGATCASEAGSGYTGTLKCKSDCSGFDTSACTKSQGNGTGSGGGIGGGGLGGTGGTGGSSGGTGVASGLPSGVFAHYTIDPKKYVGKSPDGVCNSEYKAKDASFAGYSLEIRYYKTVNDCKNDANVADAESVFLPVNARSPIGDFSKSCANQKVNLPGFTGKPGILKITSSMFVTCYR